MIGCPGARAHVGSSGCLRPWGAEPLVRPVDVDHKAVCHVRPGGDEVDERPVSSAGDIAFVPDHYLHEGLTLWPLPPCTIPTFARASVQWPPLRPERASGACGTFRPDRRMLKGTRPRS